MEIVKLDLMEHLRVLQKDKIFWNPRQSYMEYVLELMLIAKKEGEGNEPHT